MLAILLPVSAEALNEGLLVFPAATTPIGPTTGAPAVGIRAARPDGTNAQWVLASCSSYYEAPSFSRSGAEMAFLDYSAGLFTTPALEIRDTASRGIRTIVPSGGALENGIETPALSPDGSMVAYTTHLSSPPEAPGSERAELWVINVDGTGAHRVGSDYVPPDSLVTWSPDGTRIAYARWDPGRFPIAGDAIVAIKPDGSDEQVLHSAIANTELFGVQNPQWSALGEIAYSVVEDGADGAELRAFNAADGSGDHAIVPYEPQGPGGPVVSTTYGAWSPSGMQLVYRSEDESSSAGSLQYSLAIVARDGSGAHELPFVGESVRRPTWTAATSLNASSAGCPAGGNPGGGNSSGGNPGGGAGPAVPALTFLRLRPTAVAAGAVLRLTLRLSGAGRLVIRLARRSQGHRRGKVCAPGRVPRHPGCSYVRVLLTQSRNEAAGQRTLNLRASAGGHRLRPGSYALIISAIGTAGQSGPKRQLNFAVRR